jgi:heat-inducible transcriptional repressor
VPTEKGYRVFVDSLAQPGPLGDLQTRQVRSFFAKAHGELEHMLFDTTRLLADLTSYAAMVVAPQHEVATVRSVQLVGLAPRTALVVVVLSNGAVEKHGFEVDDDTGDERLAAATGQLATALVGQPYSAVQQRSASSGDTATDDIVERALAVLRGGRAEEADHVFVGGTALMARSFDAVETVRQVLGILEQQYVVVTLLRDVVDRGLHVAIGTETGLQPLAECALVVSPYEVDGEPAGSIGVLGPSRMNYPQALAAVAVVSQRLGRRLTEG